MPPGHVAALAGTAPRTPTVLEVDEIYLPRVLAATGAATVVLLNLSRDQLDRTNEVRMVAGKWRAALAAAPHTTVVANADDPLVVWAAGASSGDGVRWVGAGLLDAVGCPSCEGRITFGTDGGWSCASCGFSRPDPLATLRVTDHGTTYHGVWADGRSYEIGLALPGRFNHANALMAAVATEAGGVDAGDALAAMAGVSDVAGRFTTASVGGVPARLMLAKNPAGWSELLDLVGEEGGDGPIVISINARTADGADPSWLWDVPFERLSGRPVVATGDRCRDLSVRLHYGRVAHQMELDPVRAVQAAMAERSVSVSTRPGSDHGHDHDHDLAPIDVIGNYTAFGELLAAGTPI
jgi:UDP-N-acetylmuramyl tripeptide synthase